MKPSRFNWLKHPFAWWGSVIIIFACTIFFAGELINHRFWLSDFEVYYKAAHRLISGENLYRHAEDGHYIFKYSPASALFFIPFLAVSFEVAKYVYWFLLTGIIVFTIHASVRLVSQETIENRKLTNTVILLTGLTLAIHFMRELHLGQVNYILLFLYTLALSAWLRKRKILFAILLAVSLLIKPFALIFLPYLLLKKNYREFLYIIIFTLVLAIVPLLFGSFSFVADQYRMWFTEMQIELGNKQNLLADANHTIFSVFARYTPLRWLVTDPVISHIYQFTLLLALILFVYHFIDLGRRKMTEENTRNTVEEFGLMIAFIPLLSFTSENAFVFTQLLVVITMLGFSRLNAWLKILSVAGFLLIGGNFGELWGRDLSDMINNYSLITIGTLILIILLYLKRRKDTLREEQTG